MRYRESENGSIFQTALGFVRMNKPTIGRYKMKVSSKAIVNGEFEDKYGKRGSQFSPNGMPSYSIPFEIEDAPEGTKSFAVVLEDKDAISASGFVWTHWLISDLKRTSVAENESISATDFTQGANTWASALGKGFFLRRYGTTEQPPSLRANCVRAGYRFGFAAWFPL